MTERQGTQDIFKHIMAAPPAEPLTLSPADLMLLREWLHADIKARAVVEVERDDLHVMLIKTNAELRAEQRRCDFRDSDLVKLRAELDALEAKQ